MHHVIPMLGSIDAFAKAEIMIQGVYRTFTFTPVS